MRVWAGIKGDWEDTAGIIFESGNAVNADAVVNAERMNDEPMLLIRYKNGTLLELSCWKYSNELDYVGDKWPFKLSMSKERNYES